MTEPACEAGFVTIADAASMAGVSRMTLHRAAADGTLPHLVLGGYRFFRLADVLDWRAARREVNHDRATVG